MSDITPTFQGEMQLAGWNQTHNGGSKVTFWLPDDSDLEPFKGLTAKKGNTAGHRFMVVMVEIGDDEQPVVKDYLTTENPKGGELAKWAGILCNDEKFWEWIESKGTPCTDSNKAREVIINFCGITSRAELDHSKGAANIFREQIMSPFNDWKELRSCKTQKCNMEPQTARTLKKTLGHSRWTEITTSKRGASPS